MRAIKPQGALIAVAAAIALNGASAQQKTLPDPRPENATTAILAAFQKYSVVAMPHGHGFKDVEDFILGLVRHPEFPNVVNDIVLEGTNSRHQAILDRYIAGDDVRFEDAQAAWRDVQPGSLDSHQSLYPLIRRINQRLIPSRRLRVIGGEPPLDWSAITTDEIRRWFRSGERDSSIARIVAREVLAKNRKALVLAGGAHLYHKMDGTAVGIYEQQYPGRTLVIELLVSCPGAFIETNRAMERRALGWPVPSLALIQNTAFADMRDMWGRIGDNIDALLYLGPSDLALLQPPPADVLIDSAYMAELRLRYAKGGATQRAWGLIDPKVIREGAANPFLCSR